MQPRPWLRRSSRCSSRPWENRGSPSLPPLTWVNLSAVGTWAFFLPMCCIGDLFDTNGVLYATRVLDLVHGLTWLLDLCWSDTIFQRCLASNVLLSGAARVWLRGPNETVWFVPTFCLLAFYSSPFSWAFSAASRFVSAIVRGLLGQACTICKHH